MRSLCLRQIDSLYEATRDRAKLASIVANPGVAGFSARFPGEIANPAPGDWSAYWELVAVCADIADGKELQLRGMSGLWTPEHGLGHSMVYDGRGSEGTVDEGFGVGQEVPLPFGADGGFNQPWMRWARRFRRRLIRATRMHGGKVMHAFWPGLTWAEIACTVQMAEQPGWSFEQVVETHLTVMREWLADLRDDELVEFAVSGHVAKAYGALFGAVIAEAKTDPRYVLSRNDWREDINISTMPRPPKRAGQMLDVDLYAANGQPHDWERLYDLAEQANCEWLECYDPQFASLSHLNLVATRYAA